MRHAFRVYIAGQSLRSRRVVANLVDVCRTALGEDPDIDLIDVLERPDLADADRILATPTVIRLRPGPSRRVIGDLTDRRRLAAAFDLDTTIREGTHHDDAE